MAAAVVPLAYQNNTSTAPDWLNKGDNAWQMIAATLVGLQSVPGLVILYGSVVKKKWAVNSAFMALYAFAAVIICWVTWAYKMSFGEKLLPFWGKAGPALGQKFLLMQAALPATVHYFSNGAVETAESTPLYPMASMVWFQCVFAAITLILLAGSLLGRMNFMAWMVFVPLWLTFSYTVGAFSLWGGGFLFQWGVMDYSGGYVIHLSSGIAGLTAAYWVGPRTPRDRQSFKPNNVLLTLAGAGLLWMGWAGFNGGDPYTANIDSSLAVLNTNICAATSLLVWTWLDVIKFKRPSLIGAVQGMITGLVCITPGAGLVQGWAAIIMGILSGSVPWFTMMILHKNSTLLQRIDDTLGVFHTHAVAGLLGGFLTGLFAEPTLCNLFLPVTNSRGAIYGGSGWMQLVKQLAGGGCVIGWNIVVTSIICVLIRLVIPLRMSDEQLEVGDDAVHKEEAYALWGDGEYDANQNGSSPDEIALQQGHFHPRSPIGATQNVGPRTPRDRQSFKPNNVLLTLAGAGLLWMGWAGFNGGDPYTANIDSSLAVLNTNICAATSLLVWTWLDVIKFKRPSLIGAVQGMITGLVCITPGAGLVQGWAAIIMGILSGSVPWFTMMILHKNSTLLQRIDDTLGVFHTHAVAGLLGGFLTGLFAEPTLCNLFLPVTNSRGAIYGGSGWMQLVKQLAGGGCVIGWNIVATSIICVLIRLVIPLRMSDEQLEVGDDAVHKEEAYALWGDGEYDANQNGSSPDEIALQQGHFHPRSPIGATQNV